MKKHRVSEWHEVRLGKYVTLLFLIFFLFQLIFINREFSIADNGDFSRYLAFVDKPCGFQSAWPAGGTEEWGRRFFSQPQIYWSFCKETVPGIWFSSAHFFWNVGMIINQAFFSSTVFTIRNAGILHYLILTVFMLFLFVEIVKEKRWLFLTFIPVLLVSVDANFSSFYNSFYAESVVLLGLQCFLITSVWLIFFADITAVAKKFYLYGFAYLVMFSVMALTKKQYLPFFLFNIPLFIYSIQKLNNSVKGRTVKFCFICATSCLLLLSGVLMYHLVNSQKGVNINNRLALYYGLLMYSNHPDELLLQLQLPQESALEIGNVRYCENEAIQIPFSTVIKGFFCDKLAYLKLYYENLNQLLQFDASSSKYIGSIPYGDHGRPPAIISVYTSLFSSVSGHVLFFIACVLYFLICIIPFGLDHLHHNILRLCTSFFMLVLICDVGLSTFNGIYEAAKHIVAANLCILAIYSLFLASAGYYLHLQVKKRFFGDL